MNTTTTPPLTGSRIVEAFRNLLEERLEEHCRASVAAIREDPMIRRSAIDPNRATRAFAWLRARTQEAHGSMGTWRDETMTRFHEDLMLLLDLLAFERKEAGL